jgi:WD40 repeat protein
VARLGTLRLRHGRNLASVAFSSDGKTLASVGDGGTVCLWDPVTGKELRTFEGRKECLRCVAFSPDGKTLVAAGRFGDVLFFWDMGTGRFLRHVGQIPRLGSVADGGPRGRVSCLAFSPDGKKLAHVWRTLRLHDAATGKELRRLAPQGKASAITCAAFSPDGKLLATGEWQQAIRLWDPAGKQLRVLRGHQECPLCLAFSPDGKTLASADEGGQLCLWDVGTGRLVRQLGEHETPILSLLFTADGTGVIAGSSDRFCLWDVRTGAEIRRFARQGRQVVSLVLSPGGRLLAGAGEDGTIRLWEVATGKPVLPFDGHRGPVDAITLSPDGTVLASRATDGILLWDVRNCKPLRRIGSESTRVFSLAFAPDGRTLASAGRDGVARLWDTGTGKEVRSFRSLEADDAQLVAFAPDGSFLVSRHATGQVRLWEPATGRLLRQFGPVRDKDQSGPGFCTVSPDGSLLALGGPNERTQFRSTAGGELVRTLEGALSGKAAAFSPDGSLLAVAEWHVVSLWEVATGKQVVRIKGPRLWEPALAFSPDGRMLATGHTDRDIRLWDVATWQERGRFTATSDRISAVSALAFTPDGRTLASAGADTTILLWRVAEHSSAGARERTGLSAAALEAVWKDLAGADAARAHAGMFRLVGDPGRAVAFLESRLRPVPEADPAQLARLIRDLDSGRFAGREAATRQLEQLGDLAAAALEEVLRRCPPLEVERRARRLLEITRQALPPPQQLRALRAVTALEHIGSADARRLLSAVGKGAPGTRLTLAAKAALKRLAERPVERP